MYSGERCNNLGLFRGGSISIIKHVILYKIVASGNGKLVAGDFPGFSQIPSTIIIKNPIQVVSMSWKNLNSPKKGCGPFALNCMISSCSVRCYKFGLLRF